MKTAQDKITKLEAQVKTLEGKKGITAARENLTRIVRHYDAFLSRFPELNPRQGHTYQISAGWAMRHGLQTSSDFWSLRQAAIKEILAGSRAEYSRGEYGQILRPVHPASNYLPSKFQAMYRSEYEAAKACIAAIESQGFDEHGGWQSGAEFDKKGRGSAINVDIYGIDVRSRLFVVQVRQYEKHYKNGFGNVRKNYFLIGYNENGNPFAHPVSAGVVHAAIKKDSSIESPVRATLAWVWEISQDRLENILRNGDVALIPAVKVPRKNVEIVRTPMVVENSHRVVADEIRVNGAVYALNPTLSHDKGQHPTKQGEGWFKVVVARRSNFWAFAAPTKD